MYKCIVEFMVERAGERFIFKKDTLWNAKENEFGTINVYNDSTNISIMPNLLNLYFEKVEK